MGKQNVILVIIIFNPKIISLKHNSITKYTLIYTRNMNTINRRVLKSFVVQTIIYFCYPEKDWLRVYADEYQ